MNQDPWRLSATTLTEAILSRRVSAREATQSVLDRIDAVNPRINAVVAEHRADQRGRDIARRKDQHRKARLNQRHRPVRDFGDAERFGVDGAGFLELERCRFHAG